MLGAIERLGVFFACPNFINKKDTMIKNIVRLVVLFLGVAIFLSACAPATKSTAVVQSADATAVPAPTTAPQQIELTEADQGKNLTLNPGDSLVVMLNSNPSTGYSWVVKPVDNAVLSLAEEPSFKADSDKLGAPGKTTLTFKAVASGSQVLTLLYQRSFEKDAQPIKTFTINVTVSGSASNTPAAAPNPAAKYCIDQGYTSEIRTAADGSQNGVCKFPNGSTCDEWAYYRGECKEGQ
jgi:inhibitor of cysteine peptidase